MTQEEINRLRAILKNFGNIKTLLADLFMPISTIQQTYGCTRESAVNMKLKAEEYLSKYGVLTLDSSIKAIQQMTNTIHVDTTTQQPQVKQNTEEQQKVKVLQVAYYPSNI
jgi:predicted sulfurtransferase